ncbi:MAG: hypothetical protein HYZ09_02715 [Candidatus Kerfeldbacteria bacterium]|nr:hypothetical protein [Candidatus Kerfeldbacteria bacterium]
MAIVRFYVMRQGEKDGDDLTPKGVGQVHDSARTNLVGKGIEFTWAFYSGMLWARQTVVTALDALHHEMPLGGTQVEEGFGYLETEEMFPIANHKEMIDARAKLGETITVLDWLREWTGAAILRGRVQMTLLFLAKRLVAAVKTRERFNILVASHSPTGELACLDPATTPMLREADIMVYEVEVNEDGDARITKSEILRAPY